MSRTTLFIFAMALMGFNQLHFPCDSYSSFVFGIMKSTGSFAKSPWRNEGTFRQAIFTPFTYNQEKVQNPGRVLRASVLDEVPGVSFSS